MITSVGDRYEDAGIYRADRKGFRPVKEAESDSSDFQRALGVPEQCIIHNAVYVLCGSVEWHACAHGFHTRFPYSFTWAMCRWRYMHTY